MALIPLIIIAALVSVFFGTLRFLYILPSRNHASRIRRRPSISSSSSSSDKLDRHHVLIVLGSGGHTTEMLDLLPCMDTTRIAHRSYVFSSGDAYSATLARNFEEQLAFKKQQQRKRKAEIETEEVIEKAVAAVEVPIVSPSAAAVAQVESEVKKEDEFVIVDNEDAEASSSTAPTLINEQQPQQQPQQPQAQVQSAKLRKSPRMTPPSPPAPVSAAAAAAYDLREIPRARRVGQSWLSTPYTCLLCFCSCLSIVRGGPSKSADGGKGWPSLIICNGPGTAVMVAAASYVFRYFGLVRTKIVYVESFTRITELSLSGKLLLPFADRFVVQWPELAKKYKSVELLEMVDGVKRGEEQPAVSA